jgi:PST family polysaccharide transporter
MKRFLNKLRGSEFVAASTLTAISTAVKMISLFVISKVIAGKVGPEGLGIVGQISSFVALVMGFSTGAINNGIITLVAANKGDKSEIYCIIKAAIIITLLCSSILSLSLIFMAPQACYYLLHIDSGYIPIIRLFGFTLFFYSINSISLSIINGEKDFKTFNIINMISSAVSLAFSLVLIHYYGLKGALFAMVSHQSIVFLILLFFMSKVYVFNGDIWKSMVNKSHFYKLFGYSMMAIVSISILPSVQIFVRNLILNTSGNSEVGLYEAITRLSGIYITFLTTVLSVYYMPRLAETKSCKDVSGVIFRFYKIIIPLLLLLTSVIYFSRNIIIELVFAQSFLSMGNLFLPQLAGDIFKILSWVLALQMMAKASTKLFITTELVAGLLLFICSLVLIPLTGALGAVYAYMLNYIGYFLLMIFLYRKTLFYNYYASHS